MTDTANTSTPSEQQPAPPKRKKRLLRGFVLSALSVLTVSAGAIGWLVGTESGLRFGLYKIPSWFGVKTFNQRAFQCVRRDFDAEP